MQLPAFFSDKYVQALGVAAGIWFLSQNLKPAFLYNEDGDLHSECISPELIGVLAGLGMLIYKSRNSVLATGSSAAGIAPTPQEAAQGVSAEFRAMTMSGF